MVTGGEPGGDRERCRCDECPRLERAEHPAEVDWTVDLMTTHYATSPDRPMLR